MSASHSLDKLVVVEDEDLDEAQRQCTSFTAACYGFVGETDMSQVRYKSWVKKTTNYKVTKAPELKTLPPTSEAFSQHVLRAHLQVAVWRSALCDPPDLKPERYGWHMNETSKNLEPVLLPENVPLVPEPVKHIIKCGCASKNPCSTARCS